MKKLESLYRIFKGKGLLRRRLNFMDVSGTVNGIDKRMVLLHVLQLTRGGGKNGF